MASPISVALLITTAVTSVGLLLHIIGLSTPNWMELKPAHEEDVSYSFGLFETCGANTCARISAKYLPSYYKATQAMMILATLSAILACAMPVIGCIYSLYLKPLPKRIIVICLGAGFATFLFTLIGVVVWVTKFYNQMSGDINIGFSVPLVCVGAIMVTCGGGLFWWRKGPPADSGSLRIPIA